jgi:hypothetical protein
MADDGSPRDHLFRLFSGFIITKSVAVAVQLGLPELVSQRPRPAEELAGIAGADNDAVRRLLRTLAAVGVFAHRDGIVEHTPLSQLLDRRRPGSLGAQALLFGKLQFSTWDDALETFRTGEPAFERTHGMPLFDWLAAHPEDAALFTEAMAGGATARRTALLGLDWSSCSSVVDVGGADGTTLVALLEQEAHLTGTVFDLPHVEDAAGQVIDRAGLDGRCRFAAGSFFYDVIPRGADTYVMSRILHDWDDTSAAAILRNVRAAMHDGSRLLLVESVIADGDDADNAKILDLHMLVALGGRERSESEWRELLTANGFGTPVLHPGVLEAAPVG